MIAVQARAVPHKKPVAGDVVYLLPSFEISVVSIVLVAVGATLGLGTLIIGIGAPLLVGTCALIRGIGTLERSLMRHLLGVAVDEPRPRRQARGFWRFTLAALSDGQMWRTLLFIVLKLPISLITLILAAVSLAIPLGLMLTPLGYLIPTVILMILGIQVPDTSPAWLTPIEIVITGQFDPLMLAKTLLFAAIGVGLWIPARIALRGLAEFLAALTRGLLISG
jgi:hypothetical protein